ncbi:chorismate mutase [Rhodocaloribacter sp.]|jgi:chorismate mutase-like protein
MIQTVLDVIAPLAADPPAVPGEPTADDLGPWRERIDALDRAILHLLNERSRCANVIGHIKKQLGMPVYVPSREEEVLDNVFTANPGPLPSEAVRRLFERIIDETRALERRKYQDEPEP